MCHSGLLAVDVCETLGAFVAKDKYNCFVNGTPATQDTSVTKDVQAVSRKDKILA
jgi:hypothetical protein